jgi:hypothetical protein
MNKSTAICGILIFSLVFYAYTSESVKKEKADEAKAKMEQLTFGSYPMIGIFTTKSHSEK